MAGRRVIQDSDDEDDDLFIQSSPQKNSTLPSQNLNPPKFTPSNNVATSSTDPVIYRTAYNAQHRAAFEPSEPVLTNSFRSGQLPALEDQIINQRMTSSPLDETTNPPMSVRRLKRSRTIHSSSLTSVASPNERKAKRTKSNGEAARSDPRTEPLEQRGETESSDPRPEPMKPRGDKPTQSSTPGKYGTSPTIWDVPDSSDPRPEPLKLRGKGNVTKEKKSDGKLQRSKSISQNESSRSDTWNENGQEQPKSSVPEEKKTAGKLKRSKTIADERSNQSNSWDREKDASQDGDAIAAQNTSSSVGWQNGQEQRRSSVTEVVKTQGKLKRSIPIADDMLSSLPEQQPSSSLPGVGEGAKSSVPKLKSNLKRSKTLTEQRSSQSEMAMREKTVSKDDSHIGRKRGASYSQDANGESSEPNSKRQKQHFESTDNGEGFMNSAESTRGTDDVSRTDPLNSGRSRTKSTSKSSPKSTERIGNEFTSTIQVPRSNSEEAAAWNNTTPDHALAVGSSIVMVTSPRMNVAREGRDPTSVQKSASSISIVPATFTESQKIGYEDVSVASTNQEHGSSLAEVNVAQQNKDTTGTPQTRPSLNAARKPSTSPPPTIAGQMKRAKSASGVQASVTGSQASAASTASVTAKTAPKKKRSKTVSGMRASQISVDELSYTSQELELSSVPVKQPPKKAVKQPEERVNSDELFGSDEIGLPHERYVPRPSLRRSMSMSTTSAEAALDLNPGLPPKVRRKSAKASKATKKLADEAASAEQSDKAVLSTTDNNELTSGTSLGTRESSADNGETGAVVEVMRTSSDHNIVPPTHEDPVADKIIGAAGFQKDVTPVLDSAASDLDTPVEMDAIETPALPVPAAAPKRRGRPLNTTVAPAVKKSVEVAAENSVPLKKSSDLTETPANPPTKAAAPVKRRGRPPKSVPVYPERVVKAADEVEAQSKDDFDVERSTGREDSVDDHSENQVNRRSMSKPSDFLAPKSTPPNETTAALPLVTPTKNVMKKGPDHSPLPKGKVGYRVGLSRNHRIEPLLKMSKKP